jgi:hypothetical protein
MIENKRQRSVSNRMRLFHSIIYGKRLSLPAVETLTIFDLEIVEVRPIDIQEENCRCIATTKQKE